MYDKSLMNTKRNKVLITGGCGFIGSHTATLLLEKGFNLVTVGSDQRFMSSGAKTAIEKIRGAKKVPDSKGY